MALTGTFGSFPIDWINAKNYGAVGDGVTDDTTALQNAITACIGTGTLTPKPLYIPAGNYLISGSLNVLTGNSGLLTGWHVFGDSRYTTTITQNTDNTPIFLCAPSLMHSCLFEHMTLTFTNMQTGHTSGNVFSFTGTGANDIYNSRWYNISAQNFYHFMDCPSVLFWGNDYEFCWFGDFAHGINNIQGSAGEPRCSFRNLYISCASATGILFNHNAVSARFDNIEVNGANSGALMLYDGAGGTAIISHWALEVAHYSTTNVNLWDIPNGYLKAEWIYANTLTIDTGINVFGFNNSGAASRVDVERFDVTFASNAGAFYLNRGGAPNNPNRFRYLNGMAFNAGSAGSAVCQLTLVSASTAADNLIVEDWADTGRVNITNNADVTLSAGSAYLQIFSTPLTADRTLTLPESRSNSGNNLYSGRRFRVVREHSASAAFALNIKDIAGTTLATIASSTSGLVELTWTRDLGNTSFTWIITDNHTI